MINNAGSWPWDGKRMVKRTDQHSRFIARKVPEIADKLVCYWVPHTRKYCVGVWANGVRSAVRVLLVRDSPQAITAHDLAYVRFQFKADRRKLLRAWRQAVFATKREEDTALDEKDREWRSKKKFLRSRLNIHQRRDCVG